VCFLYCPGATEVNHENSLLNTSVKGYRYINLTGYTTILIVHGCPTRGPPGCIKRSALIFVNHVYSTKLHDNIGSYVSYLMLILHVRPANNPVIRVVALYHTQTRWTSLRQSGGLQVSYAVSYKNPVFFPRSIFYVFRTILRSMTVICILTAASLHRQVF
jgi:hypothetical protein